MKKLTPMRAIRAKCLDCCCGNPVEVRLCAIDSCSLWAYRSGHRPKDEILGKNKSSGQPQSYDGHGEQIKEVK